MSPQVIPYARAGETPADWWNYVVIDLTSGREIRDVLEADAAQGWAIIYLRDAEGDFFLDASESAATRRVEGSFEIRRKR